ncbi:long-chain acyl-CoA synthetase [Medicago truncatula]|uniref:Long-chain acyl-CoA synthetase n=1 Tax=Medicago truncatula TaxID=3880 RepID=G7J0X9_MEDTR|nr:long-chain acyl-CoA synthetase [Medicago truncatula]
METATTLTGLLQSVAEKFPSRRAISVAGKFDLTHSQLHELVESAANHLISAGIKPNDVVALTFPNTIEYVIMFLAVIRVRATAAPLNAAYTSEEFEFYLSDSESKLLLTPLEGNNPAQTAATKLNIPLGSVCFNKTEEETKLSISLNQTESANSVSELINEPSDVALFLHTSGTTSRPKGVPLSQHNLVSSVRNIESVYRLSELDSTVIVLPLFHVHGLIAGLLSSLGAGGAVALPAAGRFSASTFWKDMIQYNATWYTAVPTIHQIILDRHQSNPEPVYPKLRFIRSCSASLAPVILGRLEEAFGAPVLEAYAMTEATHLMCSNPLPEDGPHKAGSVGKPVGQEMAILDESGRVLEADVNGEVCIKGENVTKGYKNNEEANKSAFLFGWFHTGDIGYFDSDGYLHLVGRIKELINRGGEKISPIEVDAVLLGHQDVAQAVAFGVPDQKYGEEVCRFLILMFVLTLHIFI